MPPRPSPSRVAAALDYLQRLKSGVGEFVGGVGSNLADRARAAGGLAYEALTTDPNIGRMTTAEFSQAAADRAPTPRLDQAARDIGTIGRAIVTQPVETGKAIVGGEIDRFKGAFASPQALGDYAGSLIDPMRLAAALRHRVPISELDVYHGTPHKYAPTEANPLGEFDASKIGTGEGAQAYGHGIYFAERENVARDYAHSLSQRLPDRIKLDSVPVKGDDFFSRSLEDMALLGKQSALQKLDDNIRFNEKYAPEMAALYRSTREQIEKIDPASVSLNRGHLLKADLPDEMIDRMLDWDKPLSEQPAAVREALAMIDPETWHPSSDDFDANELGQSIYNRLMHQNRAAGIESGKLANTTLHGAQAKASEDLRAFGIPGIKYLDAGSRGQGGGGTRNFVVFPGEEKKVRILERNGQPAPERIAQALEAAPAVAKRPTALPTIKPGDVVDGYKVRPDIPNQSSIAASLDNYEVLPGIRSINMAEFDPQYVKSISPDKLDSRTRKLMDEISQSKELNPLIVAYDSKGPYIIEGGHRFDALAASKAKSVPAMVVIDMDDPPR